MWTHIEDALWGRIAKEARWEHTTFSAHFVDAHWKGTFKTDIKDAISITNIHT